MWIWSLVVTQPVVLLAFLLNRGAQNLLSSKTHQFPIVPLFYSIFSEFCLFIAIPVIALPPPVSADRKLVST
jgi:hypothetical protein